MKTTNKRNKSKSNSWISFCLFSCRLYSSVNKHLAARGALADVAKRVRRSHTANIRIRKMKNAFNGQRWNMVVRKTYTCARITFTWMKSSHNEFSFVFCSRLLRFESKWRKDENTQSTVSPNTRAQSEAAQVAANLRQPKHFILSLIWYSIFRFFSCLRSSCRCQYIRIVILPSPLHPHPSLSFTSSHREFVHVSNKMVRMCVR